jgi:hypothetical protein
VTADHHPDQPYASAKPEKNQRKTESNQKNSVKTEPNQKNPAKTRKNQAKTESN